VGKNEGVKSYERRIGIEWVMDSTLSLTLNAHGKLSLTEDGWSGWIVPESDDRPKLEIPPQARRRRRPDRLAHRSSIERSMRRCSRC
jgi:hypothetical protein